MVNDCFEEGSISDTSGASDAFMKVRWPLEATLATKRKLAISIMNAEQDEVRKRVGVMDSEQNEAGVPAVELESKAPESEYEHDQVNPPDPKEEAVVPQGKWPLTAKVTVIQKNPKAPGSKCHVRYEKYKLGKTLN